MKATKNSNSKKTLLLFIIIVIIIAAAAAIFLYLFPKERRADYSRLSSEKYDTVFLSMYPIDNFHEEDFAYWRGLTTVKTSYEIPDYATLKSYLNVIGKSGNIINTIYLGVQPEDISSDKLASLLQTYPGVRFEIILPNPSLDYWLKLSDSECNTKLNAYRDFTLPLLQYENMAVYYFGATEWLIANPANYTGDFLTTEKAALTIMLNADRDHAFLLDVDKTDAALEYLAAYIAENRITPPAYPDMSNHSIICLGDSVIANYDGSTSIAGVLEGLTNAQVFNLALGGGSATEAPDNNCSMNDIIDTLITGNISALPLNTESPHDARLLENLSVYLETETREDLCFVINYGLNDYFSGLPVSSDNPFDIYTYSGAIRTAVSKIQNAFPNARILLMSPNFTAYYGNGTEHRFEATHTLQDYADTVVALANELNVILVDNYNELGINADNHFQYLADGCHPNEKGRFLIGQRIALKLNN